MGRICNKCLSPIEEGGNFCTQCGSSDIREDVATVATPIEATPMVSTIDLGAATTQPTIAEVPKRSFGDVPDFMGGNSTEVVNVQQPVVDTIPQTTQPIFPTTPITVSTMPATAPVVETTNQTLFPEEEKKEKKSNKLVFIILGAIGLLLVIGGIVAILVLGNKKEPAAPPKTKNTGTVVENDGKSLRIGSSDFGYVSVPNDWVKFVDTSGSDTLQYTDNGTWIITLYSVPKSTKSAEDWASYVHDNLILDGATNVNTTKSKISDFDAIEVSGYYKDDNIYLTTWFFEDGKNLTHYLALEGPDKTGDNYNIIKSFSTNK